MTEVENLTILVLQEIRDEMRSMRQEQVQTNQRLDQTNQRLDRMQSELVYIRRDMLTRATAPEVDDLSARVVKIEARLEKIDPAGSTR